MRGFSMRFSLLVGFAGAVLSVSSAMAQTAIPNSDALVAQIRKALANEIVTLSVSNQNKRLAGIDPQTITQLDNRWVSESASTSKPLIAATLSNPLSTYLTRIQAHSVGLYTEIFVMDAVGLNVGQSNFTSDYWQGDEAKWQKTYLAGPQAVFIDEAEWHEDSGTWRAQVNLSISDAAGAQAIGAATFEINLTEWQRRQ
tara:strand:+ start:648 stop:1244 length:597 start_codon:yes stop_codon:yes gene_type:complete